MQSLSMQTQLFHNRKCLYFENQLNSQVFEGKLLPSNKPVTVLADTGATHSFCSEQFARTHLQRITQTHTRSVKLADDSFTLQVSGAIMCRLQLADVQVEFQALVLSGDTAGFDVILGDTFFRKYNTSLQFSSKSLEID
jgi:hypothetical protein